MRGVIVLDDDDAKGDAYGMDASDTQPIDQSRGVPICDKGFVASEAWVGDHFAAIHVSCFLSFLVSCTGMLQEK